MAKITDLNALEVLDSRGNPTIKTYITLENSYKASAYVPSGASTGAYEAYEKRDGESRYLGKGVRNAINSILTEIKPAILNKDFSQRLLDDALIGLDGSNNKSRLGANAILSVSLAFARAFAKLEGKELFEALGDKKRLPVPFLNILNGGSHADTNVDFQEFMIVPTGFDSFEEALQAGCEIYHFLKKELNKRGLSTGLGDEGGFAPNLKANDEAYDLIASAVDSAGYKLGSQISLALDAASSEFYKDGFYEFEGQKRSSDFMIDYYANLCKTYPVISIEDGLYEDDFEGWASLTSAIGGNVQLVGDDFFVTNPSRLQKGIDLNAANAILVKVNQIGTLSESLDAINLAISSGYKAMISHRSGETEDSFIADLAVATGSGQIKTGAPARGERTAKYNRLLEISYLLGNSASYGL